MEVKLVARTLDLVELFAQERRPMPLTELAQGLGAPMSSCLALVRTLVGRGYLYEVRRRGGYYPTPRLAAMCALIQDGDPWLERLRPRLAALRDATGETAMLGKIQDGAVVFLDVAESAQPVHYAPRPGARGQGFRQMMDGIEVGRVNVAARGCGVALRAFELAIGYARRRTAFGRPISGHQAVAFKLAEMATKVEAAHLMMVNAARIKDAGGRGDVEAGMAKLFASEAAMEIALNAVRIHGGYGYSTEYDVERYFRDAPLMIVGEGTNEIQRNVIAGQLVARGGI